MANLIVTVIAIVLVGAMALAAVYYGGAAWNKSQSQGEAGSISNEAMQVEGAISVFHGEKNRYPSDMTELVDSEYIIGSSDMKNWQFSQNAAIASIGVGEKAFRACVEARRMKGFDTENSCNDVASAGCIPATDTAPSGCNSNCLRTCYTPGGATPRQTLNPQMSSNDVCCVNNATLEIADPVIVQ